MIFLVLIFSWKKRNNVNNGINRLMLSKSGFDIWLRFISFAIGNVFDDDLKTIHI